MSRRVLCQKLGGGAVDFLTGLSAYYKFENNLNDYTGVNNGTPTGVTYTTGQVGNCGVFDGTTGSVNIADNDSLSFTDGTNDVPFTIVFGLYLTTITSVNEFIIGKQNEYAIRRLNTNVIQAFLFSEGSESNFLRIDYDISGLSLNTWYHFAYTYDGSGSELGLKLKVNNTVPSVVQINNVYVKTFNGTSIVRLSSRPNAGAALRLSGRLDDFAIYKNREFTNAEITAAYNLWTAGLPLIT